MKCVIPEVDCDPTLSDVSTPQLVVNLVAGSGFGDVCSAGLRRRWAGVRVGRRKKPRVYYPDPTT